MKPSEYVRHNLHTPNFTQKDFLEHIKYYDKKLIELDKKFIDKEELKEKILKRIKETDKSSEYGWSCISKDDILELLK